MQRHKSNVRQLFTLHHLCDLTAAGDGCSDAYFGIGQGWLCLGLIYLIFIAPIVMIVLAFCCTPNVGLSRYHCWFICREWHLPMYYWRARARQVCIWRDGT